MENTYCGKSCADCPERELLGCPGCKEGPGRAFVGDCELAKCCTGKGQSSCEDCAFNPSCTKLWAKDRISQQRLNNLETEKRRTEVLSRKAPVMEKWLKIMFWLLIPGIILSLFSSDAVAENAPGLFRAGQALSTLCSVAYALILLRLSKEEEQYRSAAVCMLIGIAVSAVTNWIFAGKEVPGWALVISIATTILSLVAAYHELMAHSTVMGGVDDTMAGKWDTLWKWYIGSYGAFAGGMVVMLVIPVLGLLVMTAGSIGQIVVGILKMVYLNRSAKRFWEYSVQGV